MNIGKRGVEALTAKEEDMVDEVLGRPPVVRCRVCHKPSETGVHPECQKRKFSCTGFPDHPEELPPLVMPPPMTLPWIRRSPGTTSRCAVGTSPLPAVWGQRHHDRHGLPRVPPGLFEGLPEAQELSACKAARWHRGALYPRAIVELAILTQSGGAEHRLTVIPR